MNPSVTIPALVVFILANLLLSPCQPQSDSLKPLIFYGIFLAVTPQPATRCPQTFTAL